MLQKTGHFQTFDNNSSYHGTDNRGPGGCRKKMEINFVFSSIKPPFFHTLLFLRKSATPHIFGESKIRKFPLYCRKSPESNSYTDHNLCRRAIYSAAENAEFIDRKARAYFSFLTYSFSLLYIGRNLSFVFHFCLLEAAFDEVVNILSFAASPQKPFFQIFVHQS